MNVVCYLVGVQLFENWLQRLLSFTGVPTEAAETERETQVKEPSRVFDYCTC